MSISGAGPPPLINVTDDHDKMDIDGNSTATPELEDNGSEATLVNEDLPPPYSGSHEEDYVMVHMDAKSNQDKENLAPNRELPTSFIGPHRAPLQDVAMKEVQNTSEELSENIQKDKEIQAPLTPPPEMPDRPPPPIPPRPKRSEPSQGDMMFGRQQDVTECIGNVMFQLEAAIKPEQIDENGEQIDIVKK